VKGSASNSAAPTSETGGARKSVSDNLPRASSTASRTLFNFWLDALMLCVFVLLVWTSTVVRFVFPPAITADNWRLWGRSLDEWMGFQFGLLCTMTLLVVLHLMLHWSWICGVIAARWLPRHDGKKRALDDGTRTLWGVGLLILLLNLMGVGIAIAVLTVAGP
jgi:hypothetical protein